jgi:hypothetical protein
MGVRRLLLVLAATVLALTATLAPARAPVAQAATDGLTLSTAATYTLVPARHVIRVVLDVTARNNKPNVTAGGIITKYFYEGARLAIQSEATALKATSNGVRLTVTTRAADGYRILEVRFRSALFFHQSAKVRVTFDLPGGAPRSASDIRVGTAFATFTAWAYGDTASVRVVIPAGFEAEATGSDAARTTSGGATIFRAAGITDIGSWYLVVNADRRSALTSDRIDLSGGEHVVIRAWPEDTEWRTRVSELITKGLPKLVEATGLDWPVSADLSIFEVHTPLLEGYAGVFFVGEDRIEISEDLDDLTILHEASHAWFNSALFDGRWINEGFADTYAAKALDAVGSGGWAPKDITPTDPAAVRLLDWTHPGRITDDATEAREQYGYEASWTVIRSIVGEVGDEGMRAVFQAAQDRQIAYVGGGPPEHLGGVADWRRFLDLLDEIGGSTGADEVFRRWVVTAAQAEVLDERAVARTAYAALVADGGEWSTPFYVRGPMSDWDFPAATARIAEAGALLARRDAIAATAAQLGVTVPPDLRTTYQAADDGLAEANAVADAEEAALRALATAVSAVDAPRAPLVSLGLIGTTPEAGLAEARSAFSTGHAGAAVQAAAVTALMDGAVEVGRGRLVAAIAGLAVVIVLLVVAIVLLRRRRGQRLGAATAAVASGAATELGTPDPVPPPALDPAAPPDTDLAAPPPYATLAAQSSPPLDGGPVPDADRATEATDGSDPPPADRGDAA